MIHLTKQERLVLLFLAGVILVGNMLALLYKMTPEFSAVLNFAEKQRLSVVDLNTANQESLEKIPYIGKTTASAIIHWRRQKGAFKTWDDLLLVEGIGPKKLELIKPYLRIGP